MRPRRGEAREGGSPDWNVVLGTLTLVFCGLLATGSVLVWVFIARETGLSQLQTDFVSKVSHELKTPLALIKMYAETLLNNCRVAMGKVDRLSGLILASAGKVMGGDRSP